MFAVSGGTIEKMRLKAIEEADFSYAPYSNFHVGAALLGVSGAIYGGCNVETGSGTTVCAERCAVYKAVSEGEKSFVALYLYAKEKGGEVIGIYPCGVCLQVLSEFVGGEFLLLRNARGKEFETIAFKELFPHPFKIKGET